MTDTSASGAADAAPVVINTSSLLPEFTALVRWLMHGLGIWLVTHGMAASRADALEPILSGLVLSGGALAWSLGQKQWAKRREVRAALAHPDDVVLK